MEIPPDKQLPIIGTEEFGLTRAHVTKILEEVKEDLAATQKSLQDSDERMNDFAKRHLPTAEAQVRALSASPDKVLAQVKRFYERTSELGSSGISEDAMIDQLEDEFNDIGNFYPLLRMTPWGYRLGQGIFAARIQKRI